MTALDMRLRLQQLTAERRYAAETGLTGNSVYMTDLDEDLASCREAYVGLAVTEIATLRAEISGPQVG